MLANRKARRCLSYMERQACRARWDKDGVNFVHGNGFLGAAYMHRSATLGPDGRWSRLYHPAIYEHAKTASHIYEAHVRHEFIECPRLDSNQRPSD